MPRLADKIIQFNNQLEFKGKLPPGVEVMNPFKDETVRELSSEFYRKFYSDNDNRFLILGINPGRFGAGVTGIPFTDPVKLEEECDIKNPWYKVTEASANFIYAMINKYGGVEKFYSRIVISAISPLGFLKNGLNYNYYDSKELLEASRDFILDSLSKTLQWEINRDICFCLGNGKNYKYLTHFNREYSFFKEIVPLPHPRWVVQYRQKKFEYFIGEYLDAFARGTGISDQ